jgi:glycosyltransferase involved in cell wall biosynthesis
LFTGFQRGKGWRDAFLVGDLFVMPSISEPFGLTPLEAAGFGTPSLISKQSGVSEILQNCLKVDFWDVDEMANQIHAVVSSSALQSVLTENVINECERLSWNESADKMLDIYRQHVGVQV